MKIRPRELPSNNSSWSGTLFLSQLILVQWEERIRNNDSFKQLGFRAWGLLSRASGGGIWGWIYSTYQSTLIYWELFLEWSLELKKLLMAKIYWVF